MHTQKTNIPAVFPWTAKPSKILTGNVPFRAIAPPHSCAVLYSTLMLIMFMIGAPLVKIAPPKRAMLCMNTTFDITDWVRPPICVFVCVCVCVCMYIYIYIYMYASMSHAV